MASLASNPQQDTTTEHKKPTATYSGSSEKKPAAGSNSKSHAPLKYTPDDTSKEHSGENHGHVDESGRQNTGGDQGVKGWKKTRRGKRGSKGKNGKTTLGDYMTGPAFAEEDKPPTEGQ